MPQLDDHDVVWVEDYRTFGILINRGATHSVIGLWRKNEWIEELIENDDYNFWQERALDYECE